MKDENKTKARLIGELRQLRKEFSSLKGKKRQQSETDVESKIDYGPVLVRVSPDPIIIVRNDVIQEVSPSFNKLFGYNKEDLSDGLKFSALAQKGERQRFKREFNNRLLRGRNKKHLEVDLLAKNGDPVFCRAYTEVIRYNGVKALLIILHDISGFKLTAEALAESEETARTLFNATNDLAGLFKVDGTIVDVNQAMADRLHSKRKKLIGTNIYDYGSPDVTAHRKKMIRKLVREKKPLRYEMVLENVVYLSSVYPIFDNVGNIIQIAVFARDITESLKLSDAYKAVVENSLQGLLLFQEGEIFIVNKALTEILGYSSNELIGNDVKAAFDIVHPDDRDMVIGHYRRRLNGEKKPFTYECRAITKNDEEIWIEISSSVVNYFGKRAIHIAITDITGRKTADEALKKSQADYHDLFDNVLDGIYRSRPDGTITRANPALVQMLGFDSEEDLCSSVRAQDLYVNPKNRDILTKRLAEEGELRDAEFVLRRKDGREITVMENARAIYDENGRVSHYEGVLRNITERIKDKEELRQTLEQLSATLSALPDLLFEVDRHGRIYRYHAPDPELLYVRPEEFIGKTIEEVIPPKAASIIMNAIKRAIKKGHDRGACYMLDLPKAGPSWFELSIAARGKSREPGRRFIILVRNITARVHTEEAYRAVVDNSIQGLIIFQDDKVIFCNQAIFDITGYGVEELLHTTTEDLIKICHPDIRDTLWRQYEKRVSGKLDQASYVLKLLHKSGHEFWSEMSVSSIDYGGKPAVLVALVDINERKRAEKALRESEEHFRLLAEQSPNMIFINQKGKIIYANARCEELMSYKVEEFYDDNFDFMSLIDTEYRDIIRRNFVDHMNGREVAPTEYVLRTKNNVRIDALITTRLITIGGEMAILGIVTDITGVKEVQEELRHSEESFKALAENANDGFLVSVDINEHVFANKVASEITGYEIEDLKNLDLKELSLPDESEQFGFNFRNWLADIDLPTRYESVLVRADGDTVPIEITAAATVWHRKPAVLLVLRDITTQKRVETELRKASDDLNAEREALENKNIALNEVLSQIANEKQAIRAQIAAKVNKAILPLIQRLKSQIDERLFRHAEMIENEISELIGAETGQIDGLFKNLTNHEFRICQMIKNGYLSREIAEELNISILTVHKHREIIRKKLGLQNQKINLSTYLQTL